MLKKYNSRFFGVLLCATLAALTSQTVAMRNQNTPEEHESKENQKKLKITQENLKFNFLYSGKKVCSLDVCNRPICRHKLSHNGKFLLVSYKNKYNSEFELFNTETKEMIYKTNYIINVSASTFSPDDKSLWIVRLNGIVEIFDLETKNFVGNNSGDFGSFKSFNNCSLCKFSHKGKLLFVAHHIKNDKGVELLDAQTFREIPDVFGIFSNNRDVFNVTSCKFSHNDEFLFVVYNYGRGKLINLNTKKSVADFEKVSNFSFSKTDEFLSVTHTNGLAKLINTKTGQEVNALEKFEKLKELDEPLGFANFEEICAYKFSPKDKFICILCSGGIARLFDKAGQSKSNIFKKFSSCKFSSDNKFLLININGLWDLTRTIFDIEKQETIVKEYPSKFYLKLDKFFILHQGEDKVLELFELPHEITDEMTRFINNLIKKKDQAESTNKNDKHGFCDTKIITRD